MLMFFVRTLRSMVKMMKMHVLLHYEKKEKKRKSSPAVCFSLCLFLSSKKIWDRECATMKSTFASSPADKRSLIYSDIHNNTVYVKTDSSPAI